MKQIISYWIKVFKNEKKDTYYQRKRKLFNKRNVQIINIELNVLKYKSIMMRGESHFDIIGRFRFTLQHKDMFYVEEEEISMKMSQHLDEISSYEIIHLFHENKEKRHCIREVVDQSSHTKRNRYDRLAAVKYAELWWNANNPNFPIFEVDCTNYISQCLLAGGAQIQGYPIRERGWWYRDNKWSFSWSVAHSLRWFLSGSKQGLQGKTVESAKELMLGDVICYDFEGNGRWDHNTIVTAKDQNGEPLVNAHTNNSRSRYWSYEDSYAWTPVCKYKFFRIELS